MSYFTLPSYDENKWSLYVENKKGLATVEDVKAMIAENSGTVGPEELSTFDYLAGKYREEYLVNLFTQIQDYSLRLPDLFPSGRIQ